MFVPPGVNDISSWLSWLQVVSDPGAYQKKIEELLDISNASKKSFEESKSALMELERKEREFDLREKQFNESMEQKNKKVQDTLDSLYERNSTLTVRENEFSQKNKEARDSLDLREMELSNRESVVYSKEQSIDSDYTKAREFRTDLENKLSRLRTIKDLLS